MVLHVPFAIGLVRFQKIDLVVVPTVSPGSYSRLLAPTRLERLQDKEKTTKTAHTILLSIPPLKT
jgi:pentose-5-phosphate-3-epimerase